MEVGGRAGACMRECVLACSGQGRGHGEGCRKCGQGGEVVVRWDKAGVRE